MAYVRECLRGKGDWETNGPVDDFIGCCASIEILQRVPRHPSRHSTSQHLDLDIHETNRDTQSEETIRMEAHGRMHVRVWW